jgi:hypothetical protein
MMGCITITMIFRNSYNKRTFFDLFYFFVGLFDDLFNIFIGQVHNFIGKFHFLSGHRVVRGQRQRGLVRAVGDADRVVATARAVATTGTVGSSAAGSAAGSAAATTTFEPTTATTTIIGICRRIVLGLTQRSLDDRLTRFARAAANAVTRTSPIAAPIHFEIGPQTLTVRIGIDGCVVANNTGRAFIDVALLISDAMVRKGRQRHGNGEKK